MTDEVEEWRAVVGWEGLYEVSSLGRVRSLSRTVLVHLSNGSTYSRPHQERILRPGRQWGYPFVNLHRGRGPNWVVRIHQLVALAFLGPRPLGMEIAHADGVRENARLANLRYATGPENEADKRRHGTAPLGEKHGSHKLSDTQVFEIRAAWPSSSYSQIAAIYGVSAASVGNIVRRETWRHLP